MFDGAVLRHEVVQLVLREEADLQVRRRLHFAGLGGELAGNEFREGRLAVAVRAEQRDAVVLVDAQVEARQDRFSGRIADGTALDGDDRRGGLLFRFGEGKALHMVFDDRGNGAHALQRLDAALRLPRLGGLGAEAVDKTLQVLAGRIVLRLRLHLQLVGFRLLAFELVVGAAIEGELLLVEMNDRVDRGVQKIPVVADDDHGVGVAADIIFQPQRALEVEIVGRFVEQQEVRLGEQHRGKRHAHAPATGETGGGPGLRLMVETEAGEDAGGTRFGRMRLDIGKPRLDFGDPVRILCRDGLGEQGLALLVRLQHDRDQRFFGARRFLRHLPDACIARHRYRSALAFHLAGDDAEERGFAGAVPADEAGFRARRKRHVGLVDEQAPGDAGRKIGYRNHVGVFADLRHERKSGIGMSLRMEGRRLYLRRGRNIMQSCRVFNQLKKYDSRNLPEIDVA